LSKKLGDLLQKIENLEAKFQLISTTPLPSTPEPYTPTPVAETKPPTPPEITPITDATTVTSDLQPKPIIPVPVSPKTISPSATKSMPPKVMKVNSVSPSSPKKRIVPPGAKQATPTLLQPNPVPKVANNPKVAIGKVGGPKKGILKGPSGATKKQ